MTSPSYHYGGLRTSLGGSSRHHPRKCLPSTFLTNASVIRSGGTGRRLVIAEAFRRSVNDLSGYDQQHLCIMRRGYHIRIVLYPKSNTSSLKLNTNDRSSFIPASLFQQLPAQKPRQTTRQNAIHNSKQKDYRYGPIRLDWVEFDKMSTGVVIGKEKEPGRGEQSEQGRVGSADQMT